MKRSKPLSDLPCLLTNLLYINRHGKIFQGRDRSQNGTKPGSGARRESHPVLLTNDVDAIRYLAAKSTRGTLPVRGECASCGRSQSTRGTDENIGTVASDSGHGECATCSEVDFAICWVDPDAIDLLGSCAAQADIRAIKVYRPGSIGCCTKRFGNEGK